jgi:hypothetical protein
MSQMFRKYLSKEFESIRRKMNPSPGGAELLSPARERWEIREIRNEPQRGDTRFLCFFDKIC